MKLRKILMGLAAVVGFTTAAMAYDVGDTITFSNVDQAASATGNGNYGPTYLQIPVSDNLPAGSVVKLKQVKYARRASNGASYAYLRVGSAAVEANASEQVVTSSSADFGGCYSLTYNFNGVNLDVGSSYTLYALNMKTGGTLTNQLGLRVFTSESYPKVVKGVYNSKDWPCVYEVKVEVVSIPAYVTATIPSGWNDTWANIPWDGGTAPTATEPAKLTLEGDATVTVSEEATCGKIALAGTGTLTLDAGDNLSTAEIKSGIPLVITTVKNQTVDTGANDLVYNYTGAAMPDTIPGVTCTGNLTFGGNSELKWTATIDKGTTFTVADTCQVYYWGNGAQVIKGTVNIGAGATFFNTRDNDVLQYSGSPTVNVYGTLDMGNTRWTVKGGNVIRMFPGGKLIGAGHATYKAIDLADAGAANVVQFDLGGAESGTATVTAGFRDRSAAPAFNIPANMTVEFGSAFSTEYSTARTINKTGAGALKLLSSLSIPEHLAVNIAAGVLDLSAMTGKTTATQIPGNMTMAETVAIRFPEEFKEGDTFTLCGGTLTAEAKVRKATVYIGDSTTPVESASLVYDTDNRTVAYTTSAEGSVVISGDTDIDGVIAAVESDWPGYEGDIMVTMEDGATLTVNTSFDYPKLTLVNPGAAIIDYTLEEADTYAKINLLNVAGALTLKTYIALPIAAGSRDLTYNYNGDDPITNTVVGITTDGVFTKGGPGTMFVNFGAGRKVATIVNEGTLAYTAQKALGDGAPITVNADGTLDFNGYPNGGDNTAITLNGGTLTNSRDIGGGGTGQKQLKSLTLTADSTIDTPYEFGMIGNSWGATTIDLGEYTLTKKGEGTFHVSTATISGTGTIRVEGGTFDFCKTASTFSDGTLELAGGTLNRDADLTAGAVTVTADSAITGEKALTAPVTVSNGATLNCSGLALPLNGVSLAVEHVGTLKITKPAKATKLALAEETVEGLTLVEDTEEGEALDYCTCDGYFWYGVETETYELSQEEQEEIEALPAGGVFVKPTLCAGLSEIEGVPEGFYAWIEEDSVVCVAKKTDSISIKFGPRTATSGTIATTDASVGGYPVAGKFWNHSKLYNNNNDPTTEIFELKDGNGETLDGVLCYYHIPNTYYGNGDQTTGNGKLTKTYFDDTPDAVASWPVSVGTYGDREYFLPPTPTTEGGVTNLRWEVAITNIPYQVFDLYIYQASDLTTNPIKLMPIAVKANDGAWHYFAGDNEGSTVAATYSSTWNGAAYCDETEMVEGTNYIRYRLSKAALGLGEEDEISVIYLSHPDRHDGARLGLAGVQIVYVENDGYYTRDPEASSNDWLSEDSWLNSSGDTTTWRNPEGSDVAYATINADSVTTITIDGEIVANEVKLVNTAPGEGEDEKTFTFTADGGTLTAPIDATGFHGKLIIPDEGLTSAISLGDTSYIEVEIPEGVEVAIEDILPAGVTIASGSIKIVGAGTVVCDGAFPTAYKACFQNAETWTGTVWLKNVSTDGAYLSEYGNANSKIKVTGVVGWVWNGDQGIADLVLEDEGETIAYEFDDTSSGWTYNFAKFSGDGTFRFATVAGSSAGVSIADVSEFTGTLLSTAGLHHDEKKGVTTARPIYVGTTTATAGTKSLISVADGATINSGCGWEAGSVAFGATLTVKGSLGDAIVSNVTNEVPVLATKVTIADTEGIYCLAYADNAVKVADAVAFTVEDCANATKTVVGAFEDSGSYYAAAGTPITVTYTADAGYFFSDGTTTLVVEGTPEDETISPTDEPTNAPFIYTIAEGEEGAWTWDGDPVEESFVDAHTAIAIQKEGTGTLAKALTNNRVYDVNGGTLQATNTNAKAVVTVNGGATFDVNGKESSEYTVVLNGGSLVNNNSTAIIVTKKQYASISQTAASFVGGTGDFSYTAGGFAANTLNLGGETLTKVGGNVFTLCKTTVTNGAFVVDAGTLKIDHDPVTFTEASLTLNEGTTLAVANTLTIPAITANGATINVTGTITPFTLTGTATLAGNGTWGTITLDGATVNVGNLRALPFLGTGTVNVQLTAAEYAQYEPITVFTSEDATVVIGTVKDADGNTLALGTDYTVDGGKVTPVDKRVALESIALSATEITIKVGETNTLTVALTPEDATIASTLWEAYDGEPGSVEVDQKGNVVGVTEGSAMVQVTVTDAFGTAKVAQCTVTVTAPGPALPSWMEGMGDENIQKYNAWATTYGVTDPNAAIKDAFLFNIENEESAVELAKERFVIHGITIDSDGTVTIEPPNEADIGVEFFNGQVNVRGSATVDGDYLLPQDDPDARFFKAFLELIPAN